MLLQYILLIGNQYKYTQKYLFLQCKLQKLLVVHLKKILQFDY